MINVMLQGAVAALIAVQVAPMIAPAGVEAIGPKQDDPLTCDVGEAGPDGVLAIGPKQDDPRSGIIVQGGRAVGSYDPETDPHAGGGGTESIGPKQDDPRQGIIVQGGRVLAIGPKQDDPRAPGMAVVGTYDPDTDPQAMKAVQGKCGKAKSAR